LFFTQSYSFLILLFIFVCCCVLFGPSEKSKWIEEKATRLPGKSNYDAILFLSFLLSFFTTFLVNSFPAVPCRCGSRILHGETTNLNMCEHFSDVMDRSMDKNHLTVNDAT
jgi:hypothetical protein